MVLSSCHVRGFSAFVAILRRALFLVASVQYNYLNIV